MKGSSLTHLYKYMTAETAMKVIASRCFRWSSPLLFNDPFDHQTGFYFPFGGEELVEEVIKRSLQIVYGPSAFTPQSGSKYGLMLNVVRANRDRIPKGEFLDGMKEAGEQVAKEFPERCAKLNQLVVDQLTNSRVLCLTETHDNVVMWSHYADQHSGVVLKVRRLDEIDHRFLAARRVDYTEEPVEYHLRLKEYVEYILGLKNYDILGDVFSLAYTKHTDWSY